MRHGTSADQLPTLAPVLGISLPVSAGDGPLSAAALREVARTADDLGFGNLSCGDHLLWHTAILDAFVASAAVAGATERASVMTGVALAPLRHPLWTIKMANTLAHLSDRFVLGLGSGGEVPPEFAAVGVDVATRGRLTDEVVSLARHLLIAEIEPQLDGLVLGPALERAVPLWLAGREGRALRRVARDADGWLGLFHTVDRFDRVARELRERAALEPRRSELACGVQLFVCVDESREQASARASTFVKTHFGRKDERIEAHFLVGTASDVAEQVEAYNRAGADFVQLHLVGGRYLESLEALARSLGHLLPSPTLMDLALARSKAAKQ